MKPPSSAVRCAASTWTSVMTTRAPSEASRCAIALPKPAAPPVTSAVFPFSRPISVSSYGRRVHDREVLVLEQVASVEVGAGAAGLQRRRAVIPKVRRDVVEHVRPARLVGDVLRGAVDHVAMVHRRVPRTVVQRR